MVPFTNNALLLTNTDLKLPFLGSTATSLLQMGKTRHKKVQSCLMLLSRPMTQHGTESRFWGIPIQYILHYSLIFLFFFAMAFMKTFLGSLNIYF